MSDTINYGLIQVTLFLFSSPICAQLKSDVWYHIVEHGDQLRLL